MHRFYNRTMKNKSHRIYPKSSSLKSSSLKSSEKTMTNRLFKNRIVKLFFKKKSAKIYPKSASPPKSTEKRKSDSSHHSSKRNTVKERASNPEEVADYIFTYLSYKIDKKYTDDVEFMVTINPYMDPLSSFITQVVENDLKILEILPLLDEIAKNINEHAQNDVRRRLMKDLENNTLYKRQKGRIQTIHENDDFNHIIDGLFKDIRVKIIRRKMSLASMKLRPTSSMNRM